MVGEKEKAEGNFNSFPLPTPALLTRAMQAKRVISNGLAMPLVGDGRFLIVLSKKGKDKTRCLSLFVCSNVSADSKTERNETFRTI